MKHLAFYLAFVINTSTITIAQQLPYELVRDDDNIWVEKFDTTVVDQNRYNWNNKIFKVGTNFLYEFIHLTKEGDTLLFELVENDNWDFVPFQSKKKMIIDRVNIAVSNGLSPFEKVLPDYNQTVITYRYGKEAIFSASGVIENEKNIWMHPPRDKYFQILELNPFPYIEFPLEVGNSWTWNLTIGDFWSDHRWKSWEGQLENSYTYEIVGLVDLESKLGLITCHIVKATAKSRIGETGLTAYFNEKYGFVQLDYANIDGSKTILNLIEKL